MNIKNLFFYLILTIYSTTYALDSVTSDTPTQIDEKSTISQDIAKTKTIDGLIEKMNRAKNQYRYMYMNAIKAKIASSKKEEREEKIKSVIEKMNSKAEAQNSLEANRGFGGGMGNSDSGEAGGGMGGAGGMGGGMGGGGSSGGMGGGGMGGGGHGKGM